MTAPASMWLRPRQEAILLPKTSTITTDAMAKRMASSHAGLTASMASLSTT